MQPMIDRLGTLPLHRVGANLTLEGVVSVRHRGYPLEHREESRKRGLIDLNRGRFRRKGPDSLEHREESRKRGLIQLNGGRFSKKVLDPLEHREKS